MSIYFAFVLYYHYYEERRLSLKLAPITDVKARLSNYLNECENEPVVITKNGYANAVLIHITDEDDLERIMLSYNKKFQKILVDAYNRIRKTCGVKEKDFWKMFK